MKVLSGPDGDGLLTNAEVMRWLREEMFDASREEELCNGRIRPPPNVREISNELLTYFEKSPSGNQKVVSVGKLFEKLRKFNLSNPELTMIANIRPEAYAHITPLIVDIYNRFDDDQVYEMLEIINQTLEPRPKIESDAEDPVVVPAIVMTGTGTEEGSARKPEAEKDEQADTAGVSIDALSIVPESDAMAD